MIVLTPSRFPGVRVAVDPDRGATVRSWIAPLPRLPTPPHGRDATCCVRQNESSLPAERLYLEPWADSPSPPDLPGGIPVLFPFAGRVAAPPALTPGTWRWHGTEYSSMPIHGFAWRLPWQTLSVRPSSGTFRLSSTPSTLALYPFPFTLTLRVRILSPSSLSLTLRIRNDGPSPLPCSPGFHPYFLLPAPATARIDLPDALVAPYDPTCTRLLAPLPPASPPLSSPHIYLSPSPFATLRLPTHSIRLTFTRRSSLPHYWQPYSRPSAPFQCLEPWTAPAGAVNYAPASFPLPLPPRQTRTLSFSLALSR